MAGKLYFSGRSLNGDRPEKMTGTGDILSGKKIEVV